MNFYDSEKMSDLLMKHGYVATDIQEDADLIIVNTCHIREKASEKLFSDLGRIKKIKDKKRLTVAVTGCVAQAEGEQISVRAPFVDLISGPQSYHRLPEMLRKISNGKSISPLLEFMPNEKFDNLEFGKNRKGPTAFISIQEGCDKFCTFCVVPYTRGAEFSRSISEIIDEVSNLTDHGVCEVTLLGQNVNTYSYSKNGKEHRISDLIKKLDQYSELKRIRYTTSHPRDMTDDLIDCYSSSKKLMPFVHLPIQSGSNKILHLMNRKHKVEDYLKVYEKLININNDIKFSSDFIIGYPGETENDFNDTLKLLDKVNFINSFSFIFSPRPGTTASNYELIDNEICKERLIIIQKKLFNNQIQINKSMEKQSIEVLVENKLENQKKYFGRNKYLSSVIFDGSEDIIGKLVEVKIENSNQNSLFGKLDNKMAAA